MQSPAFMVTMIPRQSLPTWGLKRSILWGPVYSEPYQAAVGLGINGNAFRAFVLLTCGVMLLSLLLHLHRARRRPAPQAKSPGT